MAGLKQKSSAVAAASPVLPVYRRAPVLMTRGEGAYLYDDTGKRYLDFAAGMAVNALGHAHPRLTGALKKQAEILWHSSNLYYHPGLLEFSERLVAHSFADTVFFCSTGAEAVECGIKMIRKYFRTHDQAQRYRIITMEGGFHGRTMTGISAGGNAIAREGYDPLLPGFDRVPFNDLAAVEKAITKETAGIVVEPVQGEGGIRTVEKEFLKGLRALADKHGLLLFFDEVQTGMGRTGTLFAYEQYGVTPDIMALAKGIGSGFPLAACLATAEAASGMAPGTHGSTYGGNPLGMAVGMAVLETLLEKDFLPRARNVGQYFMGALRELAVLYPDVIKEVRGLGLMLGVQVTGDHYRFAEKLRQRGLLTAPAGDNVIRLTPPLIITEEQVNDAIGILHETCQENAAR